MLLTQFNAGKTGVVDTNTLSKTTDRQPLLFPSGLQDAFQPHRVRVSS